MRRFLPIATGERLLVAPDALSRFYVSSGQGRHGAESVVGATWMTRDDRDVEIRDYVRYLDALADEVRAELNAPARECVVGFSQGVATASRWVTYGRMKPERLILWGDFTPPDLDWAQAAPAFAAADVLLVRGSADRALSSQLAQEEKVRMDEAGVSVRMVEYDGGHEIDETTLVRLAAEKVG